jgi:predicted dehydrogenase
MSETRLKGAIIGCGAMGRIHAKKLLLNSSVDLVAVVDPDPRMEAGIASLPWVDKLPTSIDFAVVAVPTALHSKVALPLLVAGVPCLVEKPLGGSLADAASLAKFDYVTVNHIERYNPNLAPVVGTSPKYIRSERLALTQSNSGRRRGGDVDVVHDLMIHDLDLVRYLTGEEVSLVKAVGASLHCDSEASGVDIAEVWLETDGGCVAVLTASRASNKRMRRLRVVDGNSYWSVDLDGGLGEQVGWDSSLSRVATESSGKDALEAMHEAFLGMVKGERASPVTGVDGLRAVELAARVSDAIKARE